MSADDYAREITKQAAARACVALGNNIINTSIFLVCSLTFVDKYINHLEQSLLFFNLGFKQSQISTLDCLADLVRHYIQSLSANTLEISEIAGRVHPGIQDVMSVLGDTV
jgi:hypothetical protein